MNSMNDITDSPLGVYQKRKAVFPKQVDGPFRRFKWLVMAVTLTIYWVTPWIRWDRGPHAPDQAVLIDLANRRFFMFSIEIWPHEFYYVAGLLIMAGVGLFLVTSAVGRAWCGYACPQTVWTDLFQHVERFLDGDRNAQIRLDRAPWTASKVWKRMRKWAVWLLISFATGGAWIFYFADAPTLQHAFWTGQAPFVAYGTTFVLTMTTFILGGFMREQVCIYMCPWPRIQAAMTDEKSLIVTYKHWRGEPRSHGKKRAASDEAHFGDCIDCLQCVQVCPTGIDIREGPQIGCITCALCIDACDKVMDQIDRPRGLIDYATELDCEREMRGEAPVPAIRRLLRPRTLVYFGLWCAIGVAMLFALGTRARIDIAANADRNPEYVRLSDGSIRNAWLIKLRNMENRPREMTIALEGLPGARMWKESDTRESAARSITVEVPADQVLKEHIYVVAPAAGSAREDFAFTVQAGGDGGEKARDAESFVRPEESE
ncbi:cytochrome c oxidase accessory protein CcoG [Sphingobium lignivorans]|uniref:Cytochrome c oxidase accessory protein FixG n=1 Tax=Sphingobium lignivorans TaxID=2735886 RepID=A0ABR6NKV1_9SPHN|nr:cytochrome c oxidase accessory protein CcoG [Sphingobium lignivorans]MBB5987913.1 cytochrome c oxidase accessory protein FixG [Sphingobium lignivorans]